MTDDNGDELTLENLTKALREAGWNVQHTTNLHLDRADWPEGTGTVLVECFDEDGLPGLYQVGTDREGVVKIGGDKVWAVHETDNEIGEARTVSKALEWITYMWDAEDEPVPDMTRRDETTFTSPVTNVTGSVNEAVHASEDLETALEWGRMAGTLYRTEQGVGSICVSADALIVWVLVQGPTVDGVPDLYAWITGWEQ